MPYMGAPFHLCSFVSNCIINIGIYIIIGIESDLAFIIILTDIALNNACIIRLLFNRLLDEIN
jgi:hypothetical protein